MCMDLTALIPPTHGSFKILTLPCLLTTMSLRALGLMLPSMSTKISESYQHLVVCLNEVQCRVLSPVSLRHQVPLRTTKPTWPTLALAL